MKPAVGIIALLALTGCTVENTYVTETTTTTLTTPPTTTVDVTEIQEELYINYLRNDHDLPPSSDELAIETGYQICDLADKGATADDFVNLLASTGSSDYEFLAGVIAAALNFLCPVHSKLLSDLGSI